MAGEDQIYDAAFKRAGIVRVKNIQDLFNVSSILAKQPRPSGPNIAIITHAGGPGVLATDAKSNLVVNLQINQMKQCKNLTPFLPAHWSKSNL